MKKGQLLLLGVLGWSAVFGAAPASRPSDSSQADSELHAILEGIAAGDTREIFDLEQNLPALAATASARSVSTRLGQVDLRNDLPSAHSLGRIALSEKTFPGIEPVFARQAAATHRAEFIPYLILMLGNPNRETRASVLESLCELLKPQNGLWQASFAAYCPASLALPRDADRRDTSFWRQWWEEHRAEIAQSAELPAISAPARYGKAATATTASLRPLR